jgi:hypothetical protein
LSSLSERKLFGSRIHRATVLVLAAATPVDSSNTTGAYAYTFTGGEPLEIYNAGPSAAYVEICASASMGAGGIRSVLLEVGEKFDLTLQAGATKVSCDGVSGATTVKIFEKQID